MCHRRLKKTSHLLGMERNDNVCRNGHDMHIIVVIYEKALSKAEENNLLSSVREKVYSIGNKVMYFFRPKDSFTRAFMQFNSPEKFERLVDQLR